MPAALWDLASVCKPWPPTPSPLADPLPGSTPFYTGLPGPWVLELTYSCAPQAALAS